MLYIRRMKYLLRIQRTIILFVPLCLFAFVSALSHAQTPAVQATVDTTRTSLDSPIRLSVTLSGEDGTVDTSTIRDFKVLSQASGSSIQIINGRVNRKRTFTFTLLPLREGTLLIPGLPVKVEGKTTFTEPITVQVSKSARPSEASVDVQVTGTIDSTRPYLGQQIVYTFQLLYGVQLANTNYEAPAFEGFSATQIGKQETGQTVVNGKRLQVVRISYLLVPLKTGLLTIAPAELQCDLVLSRRSNRSMFDSFFDDSFFGGSQLVPKVFRTDPVAVEVMPLPEWAGPEQFTGLVGQFELQADLEADSIAVGESVTLSVTLEGKGNLQDADMVRYQVPDAFKEYADQPEVNVTLGPDGYTGKKVFRTALVPVEEGDFTLNVVPMVYFNPEDASYHRLTVFPLSITVHPPENPVEMPSVFSALNTDDKPFSRKKEKVDFTGRDILSLKTGLDALSSRETMSTAWFLMLLAAPGAVILVLFGILSLMKKDERPAAVMIRKSRQALRSAACSTGEGDSFELLSNLYRSLIYSVLARAGVLGESLTLHEVETLLQANHVDNNTLSGVSELLGRLESARFGKAGLSEDQKKTLLSETQDVVKRIVG